MSEPLLSVRDLVVDYRPARGAWRRGRQPVRAVDGVSFDLAHGETLSVVGESGCGKSTLARAILRLGPRSSGQVSFRGQRLDSLDRRQVRALRRHMQMVFQDPVGVLDPRMTVEQILTEPFAIFERGLPEAARSQRVIAMLGQVGLSRDQLSRYPRELSGGQCQRVAIARALMLEPSLLVCDEPVSALDVSIRAQIVNLLGDLQSELGLAMLFIAHDLALVRHLARRVMVMYLGRTVELGESATLYASPRHPYTRALIAAVPVPDPQLEAPKHIPLSGEPPSPLAPPSGCGFRTRCPHATERCARERPALREVSGRLVACHHAERLAG